jgi:Ni,Fe-hydrogenase III large subunit
MDIPLQASLKSVCLRLNVCQAHELENKVMAIKRFAPNLARVEFVRNISGIEFDADVAQFIFLEIDQIHSAIRCAYVEDVELVVRCIYSLQPEESFSFRVSPISC